ncbi:WhiB family transcriptional regulator [Streptomyces sp. NPDC002550]
MQRKTTVSRSRRCRSNGAWKRPLRNIRVEVFVKSHTKPLLEIYRWQADAACRGMDSSVFFSPTGERGDARRRREEAARAICRSCPVSSPCGLFAETSRQADDVWDGLTEAERQEKGPGRPSPLRRPAAHGGRTSTVICHRDDRHQDPSHSTGEATGGVARLVAPRPAPPASWSRCWPSPSA